MQLLIHCVQPAQVELPISRVSIAPAFLTHSWGFVVSGDITDHCLFLVVQMNMNQAFC